MRTVGASTKLTIPMDLASRIAHSKHSHGGSVIEAELGPIGLVWSMNGRGNGYLVISAKALHPHTPIKQHFRLMSIRPNAFSVDGLCLTRITRHHLIAVAMMESL